MKIYILKKSSNKGKKYMVIDENNKKIHFGTGKNFTEHKDVDIKRAWVSRHFKANGDKFNDLETPMSWAANLLWSKDNLNDAIKFMEKKFKIKIVNEL